jgi:Tol biopolymer transport system component
MELFQCFSSSKVIVMKLMRFVPLIISVVLISCHGDNHRRREFAYPKPAPDSIPLIFLPELVSTDSFDFNAAFSPDGSSFYFSRRMNKQSDIFVTNFRNGKWTTPEAAPFNTSDYSEADPAFDDQGRIYFISNRPRDPSDTFPDYDIWYAFPGPDRGWNAAQLLDVVNSDSSEFYISVSENGNLYFASNRAGGYGEEDIYVSKILGGEYSEPENLGSIINTSKSEYDPGISPDEKFIVFTSSNREDSFGGGDLYASNRNGKTDDWKKVIHLDSTVNTKSREFCSYFSSDSKYFFFTSNGDVKWITIKSIRQQKERLI